jgi:hypothetical protein
VRRGFPGPLALLTSLALFSGLQLGAEAPAASAEAIDQPRPVGLRVNGGEGIWHADNDFRLDWDGPIDPVTGIDFRVRDETGKVVIPETHLSPQGNTIQFIHIPPAPGRQTATPGRYTADVWLEGAGGKRGVSESATLLLDGARPGSIRPSAPTGWVPGGVPVTVRLEHPASPLPVSGIRGYAVSTGSGTGLPPCDGPDRCTEAETDLRDPSADRVSLGPLPEGTSVIRAVAVSGSGMRSEETGTALVHVDATAPTVTLSGAPQGWAREPVRVTATAADALSGMSPAGPTGPFTAIAVDGGVPTVHDGDVATAIVSGNGLHSVAFYARDAAGNIVDGSGLEQPPTAKVRIDAAAPSVAFARFQDPADPERIEATVTDQLSGASQSGGSIAVRPAGSRQAFEALPTTVSAGRLTARWDSDSFPPGNYEFSATGYDVAGNSGSGDRRSTGARMVLANPLKTATALEAGFGGRRMVWQRCSRSQGRRRCHRQVTSSFEARPGARSIPYGRGVQFGGRLRSVAGSPLGGLPIQVVESFDGGSPLTARTTTVETAADGSFAVHLAPGPSRRVEAVFAGNRVLTRAGAGGVHLGVLTGVRLRASRPIATIGGAPVVFSGRVAGMPDPAAAGGRPVELQFHLPGSPWSEFRTVQTDPQGRFRYLYAFSDDDSHGVRFQFRARVPEQQGWPYEAGVSRPVAVTGR